MAASKKTTIKKPKKIKKQISEAIVNIKSSYNNTLINVTDMNGDVISWSSAGKIGFKGTKKSTPYAAKLATENCFEHFKKSGLKTLSIKMSGIGPGKSSALKTIQAMEYEIVKNKWCYTSSI